MNIERILIIPLFFLIMSCDNSTAQGDLSINKTKLQSQKKEKPSNAILAPNFDLVDLEGNNISLNSFRGKVVLLNFWGTWCGPCKREIPDFISLSEKHRDEGLEIVGITLSSGSSQKIKNFAKKWGINYILLTDINGNETQAVTALYGQATKAPITGIPTTFIIDRDGFIRERYVGPRSEEVFYRDIKPYL